MSENWQPNSTSDKQCRRPSDMSDTQRLRHWWLLGLEHTKITFHEKLSNYSHSDLAVSTQWAKHGNTLGSWSLDFHRHNISWIIHSFIYLIYLLLRIIISSSFHHHPISISTVFWCSIFRDLLNILSLFSIWSYCLEFSNVATSWIQIHHPT